MKLAAFWVELVIAATNHFRTGYCLWIVFLAPTKIGDKNQKLKLLNIISVLKKNHVRLSKFQQELTQLRRLQVSVLKRALHGNILALAAAT
jgi:hypothetical protein